MTYVTLAERAAEIHEEQGKSGKQNKQQYGGQG